MSTSNQTGLASIIGKPDLTVRFSREFLNGLFVELQAIDPPGQSPTEPIGLLFGLVNDTSVWLEKFEPLPLGKSNQTDLLGREPAEGVLEKSISEARLRLSTHLAVTGWYRVRAAEHPGLLDRDICVHNRCFKSDRDVMLLVRPEPAGRLTLELYTAKPHSLLAIHEHRRGLSQVASVNGLEGVEVNLTGTVNDKLLFLKVYEATKSLDRAEFQEKWEKVRMYMLRFTGSVRTAAWFLAIIIVSVLTYIAVIAGHLYLEPVLLHVASEATAGIGHGQRPSSQTALALKVGQNGSTLELQWSPDSAGIQNATRGTLQISDGTITRQIVLNQAQLRSGRIVYAPVSGDVTFDLEVTDSTSHSIAESIRALGSSSGAASIGSLPMQRSAAPLFNSSSSSGISRRSSQSIAASPLEGVSKKELPIGRAPSGHQVSAAARERSVSKPSERKSGGQALKDKSILEAEDWNRVKDSHNIADLEGFLQQYPSGPHVREANEAAERVRWKAVDKQSASALQAYLQQTPQGPFTADAHQRLAALLEAQRVRSESDDWNALDKTKKESLEGFLAGHPDGSHAPEARELLLGLVNEEKARQMKLAADAARRSVSPTEPRPQDSYLKDFPPGSDSGQAQHSLSEMPAASSRDADAVLAALEKYSEAWNAKNIAEIAAIRPGVDRRTVKDELSNVRSVIMRIRPISSPKIEGDRAIVECIHEVSEVFGEGIRKELPGARMTYVLVRRGGNWLIEDSH